MTTCGYEAIYSGKVLLFYVNRDSLPLSDRCNERMWTFCTQQYPKNASDIQTIRNRVIDYPKITYIEPPYHLATNPRLNVQEKLQQIQTYIQRLEYNYTGMQFFDINTNRPICGLMETARQMMTEGLPIKCLEAFFIAVYLTTGIISLDRFNISFKTRFNSITYRHIVLGIKYNQTYGALGLSRRTDLAYKPLSSKYDRLSNLIDDYLNAYKNYGHTVLRVKIGLPIVHDLKSFQTITWKALVIQPNKMDKIEYERQLDRIIRVWKQTNMYMSYRPNVPLVQSTNTLVTTASVPNRLQTISIRQNRQLSSNCHRSAMNKMSISINDNPTIVRDQSVPCAIRV